MLQQFEWKTKYKSERFTKAEAIVYAMVLRVNHNPQYQECDNNKMIKCEYFMKESVVS